MLRGRWKLSTVSIAIFLQFTLNVYSQYGQEQISIDGWKPIIGNRKPNHYKRINNYYETYSTLHPTMVPPTMTTESLQRPVFRLPSRPSFVKEKRIPHQKRYHSDPFIALPSNQNYGPHVPVNSVIHTRPSEIGHINKYATTKKPFPQISNEVAHLKSHLSSNKGIIQYVTSTKHKGKPMGLITTTSSYNEDVFTASASSGAHSSINKQNPDNIRIRETIDLGLPGKNHYTINQPHAHVEFNRYFPSTTSKTIYQQHKNPSVPTPVFGTHSPMQSIDYKILDHNEQFTKNLIILPQIYGNKDHVRNKQENIVLQIPAPFYTHHQKPENQVVVQVTKEKLHELPNNIPSNYHNQYMEYGYSNIIKSTPKPIYKVTEIINEDDLRTHSPVHEFKPTSFTKPRLETKHELPIFLPTPYKPQKSNVEPTSPTQSDVSTIYSLLSKGKEVKGPVTQDSFDVKEVSTHYPIIGKPVFLESHKYLGTPNNITNYENNEESSSTESSKIKVHRRRRPNHRRTTTTTEPTELYSVSQFEMEENLSFQTEGLINVHQPKHYKTTTEPTDVYSASQFETEENPSFQTERPINPHRPQRYKTVQTSENISINRGTNKYRHRHRDSTKRPIKQHMSFVETTSLEPKEYYKIPQIENEKMSFKNSEEINDSSKKSGVSNDETIETLEPFIILTTEADPLRSSIEPEDETQPEDEININLKENIKNTTTATITTTAVPTTSHRTKTRLKFKNSDRPRFSVKDFRQKLSRQGITTIPPDKTTEISKIKISSRRRPINTTRDNNKANLRQIMTSGTTESGQAVFITEKNVKSINTRLRPFGKQKSTTPSTTTTTKISIKPNLFKRTRPPMLTLRNKISNKFKNNIETTTETLVTKTRNEPKATITYDNTTETESTTEIITTTAKIAKDHSHTEGTIIADSTIDPYFYSQRVSDLTSSAKNEYNTPGLFKSVSPTSRRIPNYFTIATDDPILPIEAFFSNIKDKDKGSSL